MAKSLKSKTAHELLVQVKVISDICTEEIYNTHLAEEDTQIHREVVKLQKALMGLHLVLGKKLNDLMR